MSLSIRRSIIPFPILILITLLGYIGVILLYLLIFDPLNKNVPTYNILALEFAWTSEKVSQIFLSWNDVGIRAHISGVYWDFLFIPAYIIMFSGSLLILTRYLPKKLQWWGLLVSAFPFIAGILDCFENFFLLHLLMSPTSFEPGVPFLASLMASLKFALLIGSVCFMVGSVISVLISKIHKPSSPRVKKVAGKEDVPKNPPHTEDEYSIKSSKTTTEPKVKQKPITQPKSQPKSKPKIQTKKNQSSNTSNTTTPSKSAKSSKSSKSAKTQKNNVKNP